MSPPHISGLHLFCRKTTPATGKSWFIEVERAKRQHQFTSNGSKRVQPTKIAGSVKTQWKVGDIDGDGKKDFFVREKYGQINFVYFESGANKKIGFPKVWRDIKNVEVRVNKDGTFTISCKFFMLHSTSSSRTKKTWHEHTFIVGAKKVLEKHYPNAFWDSIGVRYGSPIYPYPRHRKMSKCYVHYTRTILTDRKGKSFKAAIKRPSALMWQNLPPRIVRSFMLQGAQRPAILRRTP